MNFNDFISNYFKAIEEFKNNILEIYNFQNSFKEDSRDFFKELVGFSKNKCRFVDTTIKNAGLVVPSFLEKFLLYSNYSAKFRSFYFKKTFLKETINKLKILIDSTKDIIARCSVSISNLGIFEMMMVYSDRKHVHIPELGQNETYIEFRARLLANGDKESKQLLKYYNSYAKKHFGDQEAIKKIEFLRGQFTLLKNKLLSMKSYLYARKSFYKEKYNDCRSDFLECKTQCENLFNEISGLLTGYETPLIAAIYFSFKGISFDGFRINNKNLRYKYYLMKDIKSLMLGMRNGKVCKQG